jgi:hypothetical protein
MACNVNRLDTSGAHAVVPVFSVVPWRMSNWRAAAEGTAGEEVEMKRDSGLPVLAG